MGMNTQSLELAYLTDMTSRLLSDGRMFTSYSYSGNPPWVDPPLGSVDFAPTGTLDIGGLAIGSTGTILTYQCPKGSNAVVKQLAIEYIGGGFINQSGDLQFNLEIDGVPVKNFVNLGSMVGSLVAPRQLGHGIIVESGQTLKVLVTHVANAALSYVVEAVIIGYEWPRVNTNELVKS